MKTILQLFLFFLLTDAAFTQIRYDNGPIRVSGGDFVTVRGWNRNNLTYSFQNGTADIAGNDERNAVRAAFQIWADYGNINFTEVASNGDIVILWAVGNHGDGANNAFGGQGGVLAHAFFPPPNGNFAGDIHFDDAENWTLAAQAFGGQPIDLVTVAAHEIGHAIGLDHSNEPCALMNAFYNGSQRYLSQDDINGVRALYGNRSPLVANTLSCNGGVFTINNLPVGATVNWTSSNTNIVTVSNASNTGTATRAGTASGTARITGTITLPCGQQVTEWRDLAVGLVNAGPFTIDINYCLGGSDWEFGVTASTPAVIPPGTNYIWTYDGVDQPASAATSYYTYMFPPSCLTLGIRSVNGCGTGPQFSATYCPPCPYYRITVSPNPAKDELVVQRNPRDKKPLKIEQLTITSRRGDIRKVIKAGGQDNLRIKLNDLAPGVYFIKIYDGAQWYTQSFIKE